MMAHAEVEFGLFNFRTFLRKLSVHPVERSPPTNSAWNWNLKSLTRPQHSHCAIIYFGWFWARYLHFHPIFIFIPSLLFWLSLGLSSLQMTNNDQNQWWHNGYAEVELDFSDFNFMHYWSGGSFLPDRIHIQFSQKFPKIDIWKDQTQP